jgi:hypothetical protein
MQEMETLMGKEMLVGLKKTITLLLEGDNTMELIFPISFIHRGNAHFSSSEHCEIK